MVSVIMALLLPLSAPLADLRVESARNAFRQCIATEAGKIVKVIPLDSPNAVGISPSSAVDAAREICYVLERDIRSVLPALIENTLRKDGMTSFSQSVVDMLADDTLAAAVGEDVARLKAALINDPEG